MTGLAEYVQSATNTRENYRVVLPFGELPTSSSVGRSLDRSWLSPREFMPRPATVLDPLIAARVSR